MQRHTFSLDFLAHMEADSEWLWNILWTDEAHFYLQGFVNTQNYRIYATEKPFIQVPVSLQSERKMMWCKLIACLIVGPLFLR